MSSRLRIRRKHPAAELNITAFMNLMVVLVPFLLMTAVFTQTTILDLNLPKPGSADKKTNNKDIPLEIRVILDQGALVVADNKGGIIKTIPRRNSQYDYVTLKQVLQQIKQRFPEKTNITLLSRPETPYDELIQVMDSARSFRAMYEGQVVNAELFPDISIGDAPARK